MMENNRRILIVDDDQGIRDAYRQILTPPVLADDLLSNSAVLFGENEKLKSGISQSEYELTLASRGEEGVEEVKAAMIRKEPFAVAFVDMKMPGIDGATTAKKIWELDPEIKIVIVTAFSECSPDEIVTIVGRDDLFYLNKPFNQGEIKQFTRALLEQWNLTAEREKLQFELERKNLYLNELAQALEEKVQEQWLLKNKLEKSNIDLQDLTKNLEEKVREQTALLVQSEKMASIGLLAAGVAHEVNNPTAFVGSNLASIKRYAAKIIPLLELCRELPGSDLTCNVLIEKIGNYIKTNNIDFIINDMAVLADESIDGIRRISNIVADLKSFSHIDKAEVSRVNLNEVMDTTISIIHNELKYKVEVVKEYEELPEVECFHRKISQVFMNLLINAAQAITEKGRIKIVSRTLKVGRRAADSRVEIEIADTGQGIPEKYLPKLFDPFFTTKPVGEGTGLGLSLVYDIIKGHGGTIKVKSEAGVGTVFTITLPVNPEFASNHGGD